MAHHERFSSAYPRKPRRAGTRGRTVAPPATSTLSPFGQCPEFHAKILALALALARQAAGEDDEALALSRG
jgi:hypothetical protein